MTAPATTRDPAAAASEFLQQCGPCDYGIPGTCNCPKRDYRPTMLNLVREVERLRAIVDRVEALASGAREHWNSAPVDGTLAVVTTSGGWQNQPERERAYVRSDCTPDEMKEFGLKAREDGEWWQVGDDKPYPYSWGELNWLDDPACDRGSVSIETFVSVDDLDTALGGRL